MMNNNLVPLLISLSIFFSLNVSSTPILEFKSFRATTEVGINKNYPDGRFGYDVSKERVNNPLSLLSGVSLEAKIPITRWIDPFDLEESEVSSPYAGLEFRSSYFDFITDSEVTPYDSYFGDLAIDGVYRGESYAIASFHAVFKVKGGDIEYYGGASALAGVDSARDCVHKITDIKTNSEVLNVGSDSCYGISGTVTLKEGNVYKLKAKIVHDNNDDEENYLYGSWDKRSSITVPEPNVSALLVLTVFLIAQVRRSRKGGVII